MEFVYITLGINLLCVVFGFVLSYVTLCTTWLDKNRIQTKKVTMKVFYQRLPLILFNLACLQILSGVGIYSAQGMFDQTEFYWLTFIAQFLLFLFFDDLYFYGYHRILHESEFLFKHIHKIHHKATTPFPLEFLYVHPLEWMIGAVGVLIGLLANYFIFGSVSIYTFWLYAFYRTAHEIEIHGGVEWWWSKYIPFYGSVRQHDEHHAYIKGNYASSLSYLDKIFKTEAPK